MAIVQRLRPTEAAASLHALVLNGALQDDRDVDAIARHVADELERLGLDTELVTLRDLAVAPCLGCFDCWIRTPGLCRTRDAGRDLAYAHVRSHLVAYVTPVTFGGYSSELKKVIDRAICASLPFFTRAGGEVHHRPRYPRRPALLVFGVLREPAPTQERIFHELARRSAFQLQAPAFASHVLALPGGAAASLDPDVRRAIADVLEVAAARPGAATAVGGAR